MAERHDYSEIIAEMLIQLQQNGEELRKHSTELKRQSEIQTQILERMERSDAGFNNFAIAVLDHLQGIKTELVEVKSEVSQVKTEVGNVKTEVRELKAAERLADHEERLRRLEDFMRRAS